MILNVLSKCFQVPVPVVWKSFAETTRSRASRHQSARPFLPPACLGTCNLATPASDEASVYINSLSLCNSVIITEIIFYYYTNPASDVLASSASPSMEYPASVHMPCSWGSLSSGGPEKIGIRDCPAAIRKTRWFTDFAARAGRHLSASTSRARKWPPGHETR